MRGLAAPGTHLSLGRVPADTASRCHTVKLDCGKHRHAETDKMKNWTCLDFFLSLPPPPNCGCSSSSSSSSGGKANCFATMMDLYFFFLFNLLSSEVRSGFWQTFERLNFCWHLCHALMSCYAEKWLGWFLKMLSTVPIRIRFQLWMWLCKEKKNTDYNTYYDYDERSCSLK